MAVSSPPPSSSPPLDICVTPAVYQATGDDVDPYPVHPFRDPVSGLRLRVNSDKWANACNSIVAPTLAPNASTPVYTHTHIPTRETAKEFVSWWKDSFREPLELPALLDEKLASFAPDPQMIAAKAAAAETGDRIDGHESDVNMEQLICWYHTIAAPGTGEVLRGVHLFTSIARWVAQTGGDDPSVPFFLSPAAIAPISTSGGSDAVDTKPKPGRMETPDREEDKRFSSAGAGGRAYPR